MVDICYPSGTDWSCFGTTEEVDALDPTIKARSEALAWSTLSALTGYRASLCPITVRPCAAQCGIPTWFTAPVIGSSGTSVPGSGSGPYMSNGGWYNGCGCSGPTDCSCSSISQVYLPTEVGRVESVYVNGGLLDPSAYRVDNGNRLVRTDGETWPVCQDMANSDRTNTEVTGMFVDYYTGVAPNDLLRFAAGILAAEYYKACNGGKCRLPQGVSTVTRNGITMDIPSGLFPGGATGIHEVNTVIRIYNPFALKAPARVLSPDTSRGRIQTGV